MPSLTRQVAAALDALYSDHSGLANVRKPHYRKRDVCEIFVESEGSVVLDPQTGEELVEHKSLNLMNQALPMLGKRDKPEAAAASGDEKDNTASGTTAPVAEPAAKRQKT